VFASPGVRRLARELGINLEIINGSGPKGRITKEDLNSYIKIQMVMSSGNFPPPRKDIDFSQWGDIEVQKLTKINKITGQRLQQAWQEIPHVTQYDKADITDLDALRKELKKKGAETGVKVTFLPFLLKAASIVLREMPKFNSSLDHTDQNLVLKNYYHIGVAVDTPNGLTAPSVRDVDQKLFLSFLKNSWI
jgi:pyruvate dehydrogenase E2 component (dihydrolipoamide acetyltransferase)